MDEQEEEMYRQAMSLKAEFENTPEAFVFFGDSQTDSETDPDSLPLETESWKHYTEGAKSYVHDRALYYPPAWQEYLLEAYVAVVCCGVAAFAFWVFTTLIVKYTHNH